MQVAQRLQIALLGLACFLGGCLLAGHWPSARAQDAKEPKWLYGLGLKVRKGTESEFTKDTKKIGLEVFRDENNNNLIYITEAGAIAVAPAR
jgi:hypothetical protein